MQKKKRHGAMALLEFETIAAGVLASDIMVKRSPIALLRCGTIHPGRFLILVGGSVASTEEACTTAGSMKIIFVTGVSRVSYGGDNAFRHGIIRMRFL